MFLAWALGRLSRDFGFDLGHRRLVTGATLTCPHQLFTLSLRLPAFPLADFLPQTEAPSCLTGLCLEPCFLFQALALSLLAGPHHPQLVLQRLLQPKSSFIHFLLRCLSLPSYLEHRGGGAFHPVHVVPYTRPCMDLVLNEDMLVE